MILTLFATGSLVILIYSVYLVGYRQGSMDTLSSVVDAGEEYRKRGVSQ